MEREDTAEPETTAAAYPVWEEMRRALEVGYKISVKNHEFLA